MSLGHPTASKGMMKVSYLSESTYYHIGVRDVAPKQGNTKGVHGHPGPNVPKKIQETLTTEEDENPAWNDNIHRALSCTWQRYRFLHGRWCFSTRYRKFLLTTSLNHHDWPLWHHGILKPTLDPWSCYVSPTFIPKQNLTKCRFK